MIVALGYSSSGTMNTGKLRVVKISAADGGADDDFADRGMLSRFRFIQTRTQTRTSHASVKLIAHADSHVPDASLGVRSRRLIYSQGAADGHGTYSACIGQHPH